MSNKITPQWLLISEAPLNVEGLGFCSNPEVWYSIGLTKDNISFTICDTEEGLLTHGMFTHWIPLPEPPSKEENC